MNRQPTKNKVMICYHPKLLGIDEILGDHKLLLNTLANKLEKFYNIC